MEELVQQLIEQVGLDPKQAQQVVGLVSAGAAQDKASDAAGGIMGKLGGLSGGDDT